MNRYKVSLSIAINAISKKDAKEKIGALLTTGIYKGKFLKFCPNERFEEMKVERIGF